MNLVRILVCLLVCLGTLGTSPAVAQSMQEVIGAGDTVRISAFRYPELTTEARVSEEGRADAVRDPMKVIKI